MPNSISTATLNTTLKELNDKEIISVLLFLSYSKKIALLHTGIVNRMDLKIKSGSFDSLRKSAKDWTKVFRMQLLK